MPIGKSAASKAKACLPLILLACLLATHHLGAVSSSGQGAIIRHELTVELVPHTHELIAKDKVDLRVSNNVREIAFTLAPSLQVESLEVVSQENGKLPLPSRSVPFKSEFLTEPSTQRIVADLPVLSEGTVTLLWTYRGVIDDPPKEPRHLRFVTPSETAGHIGPEGVYLSIESQWYPDVEGSLSTFRVTATVPDEWRVVTQGRRLEESQGEGKSTSVWAAQDRAEALTLVANRFISKWREWRDAHGRRVELATYFLPENADLADEYLDATAKYLETYVPLLGEYPFEKFAVVENFFASGLGMPSFTLLGSGIIKRHYVQPYALGHEIVHSWIGNSVFNRIDGGNWVEGLTTYLANYYWHESSGDPLQAREQRRLMVRGYNLHVPPDRDYPVARFTRKQDERDNAVGYQKAAMVFHLLRQEVGEDAFWPALKRFVAQYRGRHAEWSDLERVFTEAAGRDLRWFFVQWIEKTDAPQLSLQAAVARPVADDAGGKFHLTVRIAQTGRAFRLGVPLRVTLADGREQTIQAEVGALHNSIEALLPAKPIALELDPDTNLLRRLPRQAVPPVLNHYVTDRRRSVLMAFSDPPSGSHPFRGLVKRIEAQNDQKPDQEGDSIIPLVPGALLPKEGSVLVLGSPESRTQVQSLLSAHCGDRLQFRDSGVVLAEKEYEGAGLAVLVSCHRAERPGSTVTLLYAQTPKAAVTIARLLFFYGWNSYVVFQDGTPVARGEWADSHDRVEVTVDGSEAFR